MSTRWSLILVYFALQVVPFFLHYFWSRCYIPRLERLLQFVGNLLPPASSCSVTHIGSVDETNKTHTVITYYKGGQRFQIKFPKYRGPCPYVCIWDAPRGDDGKILPVDLPYQIDRCNL